MMKRVFWETGGMGAAELEHCTDDVGYTEYPGLWLRSTRSASIQRLPRMVPKLVRLLCMVSCAICRGCLCKEDSEYRSVSLGTLSLDIRSYGTAGGSLHILFAAADPCLSPGAIFP